MAQKVDECFNPPHIKSLKLNWKIHGKGKQSYRMANSASSSLVLPSSQQSMVLANLLPLSNYSLSLYSFSQCARSPTISLKVSTKNPMMVHQTVTTLLPIEIGLIVLVLLLWAIILHHFLRLYKKITLVNVMPMGGYYNGHKKDSRFSAASRLSNASATSKTSNVNQFDILEDAVCAWRSETVLSTKYQREQHHSVNESREATIIPDNFPKKTRSAKTSINSIRRFSRASLAAPPVPSEPYYSDPNLRAIQPSAFQPIDPSLSFPLTAYTQETQCVGKPLPILPFDEEKKVEDSKKDNPRTTSVILNQRRVSTNPYVLIAPEGGPPKRKISAVVLGKATNDIRRCSSFATMSPTSLQFGRKTSAKRTSLRRRLSNINTTIQKKFSIKGKNRRRIDKMDSLREGESETSSGEEGSSTKCLPRRQRSTSSSSHPKCP
uniref:Fibronectin type III domain-containing protein n=1 Tax=Ditylenchus dipsaci TaxID=166011 RepID=A0A915DJZ4_9BILA